MLRRVLEAVDQFGLDQFPVEVDDICTIMVNLGIQDRIQCDAQSFKDEALLGMYYQYRERHVPYGDPQQTSQVIYSADVGIAHQRLICVKELVHICDSAQQQTMTPEELEKLLNVLLAGKEAPDFGLSNYQATKDKIALYEAVALLFPKTPRAHEKRALETSEKTITEIARDACLPEDVVSFVMTDEWELLRQELYENC